MKSLPHILCIFFNLLFMMKCIKFETKNTFQFNESEQSNEAEPKLLQLLSIKKNQVHLERNFLPFKLNSFNCSNNTCSCCLNLEVGRIKLNKTGTQIQYIINLIFVLYK